MDFRVELIGPRERRALLVATMALLAVVATSIAYLRPAVPASATSPRIVSAATSRATTSFQPVAYEVLPGTGRPTGGYFIWTVALPGGSGGHRAR